MMRNASPRRTYAVRVESFNSRSRVIGVLGSVLHEKMMQNKFHNSECILNIFSRATNIDPVAELRTPFIEVLSQYVAKIEQCNDLSLRHCR